MNRGHRQCEARLRQTSPIHGVQARSAGYAGAIASISDYGKSRNKVLEMKKAGENDAANELMFTETSALQTVYIQAWKDFIQFEKSC